MKISFIRRQNENKPHFRAGGGVTQHSDGVYDRGGDLDDTFLFDSALLSGYENVQTYAEFMEERTVL